MIDEIARHYERNERRSRKQRMCCECHGMIEKGEVYVHHYGIWSWGPDNFDSCLDCEALRAELDESAKYDDEKVAFEQLSECVFESGELDWMKRFVAIKTKRHAPTADWMKRRVVD